jgi:hypothetical protein
MGNPSVMGDRLPKGQGRQSGPPLRAIPPVLAESDTHYKSPPDGMSGSDRPGIAPPRTPYPGSLPARPGGHDNGDSLAAPVGPYPGAARSHPPPWRGRAGYVPIPRTARDGRLGRPVVPRTAQWGQPGGAPGEEGTLPIVGEEVADLKVCRIALSLPEQTESTRNSRAILDLNDGKCPSDSRRAVWASPPSRA